MNYFEGLTTESDIKSRYKDMAKKHHPDLGGDAEIMKAINNQYEKVLGGAYQKAGKSLSEIEELLKKDMGALAALNLIIGIDGINVELCGCWLWVSGETKTVKDRLKESGFLWSPVKKCWYWRPPEQKYKRFSKRGEYSLDEIRLRHGSEVIKSGRKSACIA